MSDSAFVLDCSVAMSWCFSDESSAYADSILDKLTQHAKAWVPAIWSLEVSNTLVMGERRGRISEAGVLYFLDQLSYLPIQIEHPTQAHCFSSILNLAREHVLSTYDAAYLDLAIRKGLPIATLDKKIIEVAKKMKIKTL